MLLPRARHGYHVQSVKDRSFNLLEKTMRFNTSSFRWIRIASVVMALACVAVPAFAAPDVPEIDPGTMGSGLAFLLGTLALIERRRS